VPERTACPAHTLRCFPTSSFESSKSPKPCILDSSWFMRGRYLIFVALYPSKSGPIHKHIVKHTSLTSGCVINPRALNPKPQPLHPSHSVASSTLEPWSLNPNPSIPHIQLRPVRGSSGSKPNHFLARLFPFTEPSTGHKGFCPPPPPPLAASFNGFPFLYCACHVIACYSHHSFPAWRGSAFCQNTRAREFVQMSHT
jgi:hypothetical protein